MKGRSMEPLTNQNYRSVYRSPFPGMINCPQCGLSWVKEYVPEFCPECGSRVSDKAGTGMKKMLELVEKANLGINILQCPKCKLRYPQVSDKELRVCFRCWVPLVNATPVKNILRKISWHSMLIGKVLRGKF